MMFNQFTPSRAFAQTMDRFGIRLQWVLVFLACFGLSNAAWASPDYALPGDSTFSATICANETFSFEGELLHVAGVYSATYVGSDGLDSTITLVLDVLPTAEETVVASICEGGFVEFNGAVYTQAGNYPVVLTGENGCDSTVTLALTVYPVEVTNLKAGICEGTAFVFQGETLTETGLYSAVLTSVHGCDSIVQLNLQVVPFFEVGFSATICKGETFEFGGELLVDEGVYVDSLKAIGGCDSIVTLALHVLPVAVTHFNAGICEGTAYVFQGDTLTVSGIYVYPYTAANGCDSLVMLDLSVVAFFDVQAEATICHGETYVFGDSELTDAGEYTHLFSAIGGCDSTVTLTLTVLPTQTGTAEAIICDGSTFEYNGTVLSDPGQYEFVLTGENGCDSVVTLTLQVLPVPNTVLEASICAGKTYDFNGEILSDEGVYEQLYPAANGCDSVVTLILTVLTAPTTHLEATVCAGQTYDFNAEILDASGTYSQVFAAFNGCDSTVVLDLTVLPVLESTLNATICAGASYEFDGNVISDAGTYTAVFAGTNDCDSTVTLHLEVLATQSSNVEATICAGSTYAFNGALLTDAGTYPAVLQGANGCDSTVVLILNVLPTQTTNIEATICAGEGYNYFGINLTDAGTYSFDFQGENGCDSTVVILLNVLPVSHTALVATTCEGQAYDFYGEMLTDEGDYDFVYDAANGCDSIVTLHLTVLPLANTTLTVTLCSGLSYDFNGQTLIDSGTYTAVEAGANGCDSTTTLHLEFVMEFVTQLEASICPGASYDFNGQILDVSGVYADTLTAVGGCDSLVVLTLTVLPVQESETDASICAGATYLFNGEALADAGTYTATLTGSNGCDSVAVLHLTVLPLQNTSLSATTCANEAYLFNGQALTVAGTYVANLTAANGCDSIVTLELSVLPLAESSLSASICAGESYNFNGELLSQSGVYTSTYEAANGCDSVVTLQLTVFPKAESAVAAVVCDGVPFVYNNQVFTTSGEYVFVYPGAAANGCDSVETLFLTIFPVIPPTNISATICAGETYLFGNNVLSFTGIYTNDFASATGCDSVVVLNLTVLPASGSTIVASICPGDTYAFDGQLLSDEGTYTAVYTDVNGCDSSVILVLNLNVVNTVVFAQGGTLMAQAGNDAQYQWIDCTTGQPIAGATGSSFSPTITGQYAVQITTPEGCSGESDCQLVEVVAVAEPWSQANWNLQPNPANQQSMLLFNESLESELQLEMYDPAGRMLHQQRIAPGARQVELDLSSFPEGFLLVRLVSERGTASKVLVKAGQ